MTDGPQKKKKPAARSKPKQAGKPAAPAAAKKTESKAATAKSSSPAPKAAPEVSASTETPLSEAAVPVDKTVSAPAAGQAVPGNTAPPPPSGKPAGSFSIILTVFLTLAVLGGIGVGTWPFWSPLVMAYLPSADKEPPQDPRVDGLFDRIKSLEDQTKEKLSKGPTIQDLVSERDRFKKELDVLMTRLHGLEGALGSVRKMVEATVPPSEATTANQSLKELTERLMLLEKDSQSLDGLVTRMQRVESDTAAMSAASQSPQRDKSAELETSLQALTQRLGKLEQSPLTSMVTIDGQELVLAVGRLREGLRSTAAFAPELKALKDLASDHPPILQTIALVEPFAAGGIPSLAALRGRFNAESAKIAAAVPVMEGEGWLESTVNRLASLVSIRRVAVDDKADPVDLALAKAERRLKIHDLKGAIDALAALQGPPAKAAAPWLADARSRHAAERAMKELHDHAITLLARANDKGAK
ncbi:MAG: hypothetical protein ISR52_09175 [Rhodospirillales bacterium]|nr:hypothetical protein [Rhodospirillales bacterium]